MDPIEARQQIAADRRRMIHAAAADGHFKARRRFECARFDDGAGVFGTAFERFRDGGARTAVALTRDQNGKTGVTFDRPQATP